MSLKKSKRPGAALGLNIERGRIEGVVVRKSGSNLQVLRSFQAALTLDPLTNDPELVGREIRNHLNAAGIREKRCVVALPLHWVLTMQAKLPELAEEDVGAFLDLQAERGFPHAPEDLMLSRSRFQSTKKESFATLLAIPRNQLVRLDTVLRAAQLKPLSFTLGISALQSVDESRKEGIVALAVGENSIDLQIACGGGVTALRALEGTFEVVEGQKKIYADLIARELKITLGQLPDGLRESIRKVKVFGQGDVAQRLVREIQPRADTLGIMVEPVTAYRPEELGAGLSSDARVSPALSVAARFLTGTESGFEFIPPKPSHWPEFVTRYGSKRFALATAAGIVIALALLVLFTVQGVKLSRLEAEWKKLRPEKDRLEMLQGKIKLFRPWHDDSVRSLVIMRRITELFPAEGVVSIRIIEIKNQNEVVCSGVVKNAAALSEVRKKLWDAKELDQMNMETRANTFTFNFKWKESARAN